MIENSALILIDWQIGFDQHAYWGGNRNNPDAEDNALSLLRHWREHKRPIFHCIHHSQDPNSLLRREKPSGKLKPGFEPQANEPLIVKHVNSCFIGTDLHDQLQANHIEKLVICGLTTNHCVSTTVRMAGNLGYDVYLTGDACATFDRSDIDGNIIPADLIHQISLANIHGEFCKVVSTAKIITS